MKQGLTIKDYAIAVALLGGAAYGVSRIIKKEQKEKQN